MSGALVYDDYLDLIKKNKIKGIIDLDSQIQPSSVDLSLSSECYEINASFLSSRGAVRRKLDKYSINKFNLKKEKTFKKNKIYIVKLNEELKLDNLTFGHCNPKSSTGRLNIFCRTIVT